MCLILFSLNEHPQYKLILVANRDEFYARKTESANYWPGHPNILGGRDLEAMREDGTCGTWMAITTSGKIAMVTNYRDFKNLKTTAPSRGHLVSDFLIQNIEAATYLRSVESIKNDYNGFNLILGDVNNLFYLSNYKEGIDRLTPSFYGLSNHLLQTPWPKVVLAKSKLEPLIRENEIDPEELLNVMQNESRALDESLPNTGIGIDRERALSSMFIKTEGYGTRCSTVLLINCSGEAQFIERTYNLNNFSFETRRFEFSLQV
jgi:uncharacterized protein with NRDE domain